MVGVPTSEISPDPISKFPSVTSDQKEPSGDDIPEQTAKEVARIEAKRHRKELRRAKRALRRELVAKAIEEQNSIRSPVESPPRVNNPIDLYSPGSESEKKKKKIKKKRKRHQDLGDSSREVVEQSELTPQHDRQRSSFSEISPIDDDQLRKERRARRKLQKQKRRTSDVENRSTEAVRDLNISEVVQEKQKKKKKKKKHRRRVAEELSSPSSERAAELIKNRSLEVVESNISHNLQSEKTQNSRMTEDIAVDEQFHKKKRRKHRRSKVVYPSPKRGESFE